MKRIILLMMMLFVLTITVACSYSPIEQQQNETETLTDENFYPLNLVGKSGVTFWHDDKRKVSCWIYSSIREAGISCIPDNLVVGG